MKLIFTLEVEARGDMPASIHARVLQSILQEELNAKDLGIAPNVKVTEKRRRVKK